MRYHPRVLFISLVCLLAGSVLTRAQVLLQTTELANHDRRLVLNAAMTESLRGARSTLTLVDFPVTNTTSGVVHVRPRRSAIDAGTLWVVPTPDGDVKVAPPEVNLFTGVVEGEPDSKVWLVYVPATEEVFGAIEYTSGPAFVLAPSTRSNAATGEHTLVPTTQISMATTAAFSCGADEQWESELRGTRKAERLQEEFELLRIDVAVETDVEFFKATGGSIAKAQAYTAALYSVLSSMYEDEVGVFVYVPWVKTWTDVVPDPYKADGNPFVLRDSALVYWKAHYQDVQRDVYQVLTSISYGGGGFGYYDALCAKNGDYGMSSVSVQGYNPLPTAAFTYDVYITAHELGHNFNASHTHTCVYGAPLDTCLLGEATACLDSSVTARPNPGSIMSYCGGINNENGLGYQVRMTFLEPVAAVMRATAEASMCLTVDTTTAVRDEPIIAWDADTQIMDGEGIAALYDLRGSIVATNVRKHDLNAGTYGNIPNGVYYLVRRNRGVQTTPVRVIVTR